MKNLFLLLVLLLTTIAGVVNGRGGEHPAYVVDGHSLLTTTTTTKEQGNQTTTSSLFYRQNVCERHQLFSDGKIELRDALSGLSLSVVIDAEDDFLNYHSATGLDTINPGILPDILDALGDRANFTWRQSFALGRPRQLNLTWTNFLLWSIDHFDLSVGWYDKSNERMEKGAAFLEPWFDGSLILVDQRDPPLEGSINYFNWAKPFSTGVWGLIFFTIFVSGLVYQWIEHLNGEREERPLFQWVSDNMYLSSLNFTQNFEYAPNSVAGRIFAVGASVWALVITATYTANLASLFVEQQQPGLVVESIEHAILLGMPICVLGGSNHERFLKKKYRNAQLVPGSEFENYNALRRGDCGLVAAAKDSWFTYRTMSKYNPDCDLDRVGRDVKRIQSGFAVKTDAGKFCSGFIGHVLDLHMIEFINDGGLEEAWAKHRSKSAANDNSCSGTTTTTTTVQNSVTSFGGGLQRRLNKRQKQQSSGSAQSHHHHRILKKGGGGSATSASSANNNGGGETDESESALSVDQMIGTFLFHWFSMAIAILVSVATYYYDKWEIKILAQKNLVREKVIYRKHGPVIGLPPPVNTTNIVRADSAGRGDASSSTRTTNRIVSEDVSSPLRRLSSTGTVRSNQRRPSSIARNLTSGRSTMPLMTTTTTMTTGDSFNISERNQTYEEIRREIMASLEESLTTAEQPPHRQDVFGPMNGIPEWLRQSVEYQQEQQASNERRMEKMEEQLEAVLELLQKQQQQNQSS